MNNDNITIQSIHPEAKQMVVVFNIEGTTYPKVLPFFTVQDANLLKSQLQSFAKELRGEFDALKQAIQASDQNQTTQVSPDVQSLQGQTIPVDDGGTSTPSGSNGGGTSTEGGATPPPSDATPSDTVDTATDGGVQPETPATPADGGMTEQGDVTTPSF